MKKPIVKDAWTVVSARQLEDLIGYIPPTEEIHNDIHHLFHSKHDYKHYNIFLMVGGLGLNSLYSVREVVAMEISDSEKEDRKDQYAREAEGSLSDEWCKEKDCEFSSYPEDGKCSCGVYKHHVHCQHGNIIQVG